MSRTVDKRVVEMEIEKQQFERGVKETIGSLNDLKEALNFNTAQMGLNNLQLEAKNFSLSHIEEAVDSLSNRFSNLGIAGMMVFARLTNSAINFAERLASMSIGQIITGGKGRAQKVADARFQLEGLFSKYEDGAERVESAFNSASKAVDGTAYGLDAAVATASQLAASNVGLGKDMDTALRGVAGLAAMTNSSFEEMGHIFATVAGNGRLMGMQLTQISSRGINVAAELASQLGTTEEQIRTMVSKGQIDFKTFASAMESAFGDQAAKANETLTGALSNVRAALSRIGEIFYSGIIENKEYITFINNVRLAINTVKKAMEPLKVPFKNLVSAASNLGSAVLKMFNLSSFSTVINAVVKGIEYITDILNRFTKYISGIIEETHIEEAAEQVKDTVEVIDEATQEILKFAKLIWRGDYGNGQARIAALGQELYDKYQPMVNALKEANFDDVKAAQLYAEKMNIIAEESIDAADERAEAERQWREENKASLVTLTNMTNVTQALANIISSFKNIIGAVGKAFKKVFGSNNYAKEVTSISSAFRDFTEYIKVTEEDAEKLADVFAGVFSVFDMIRQVFVEVTKLAFDSLGPILSNIGNFLLDIGKRVGDTISNFREWVTENNKIKEVLNKVVELFKAIGRAAGNFIDQLSANPKFIEFKEALKEIGTEIGDKVLGFFTNALDSATDFFNYLGDQDTDVITTVFGVLNEALSQFTEMSGDAKSAVEQFFGYVDSKKETLAESGIDVQNVSDKLKKFSNQSKKSAQSKDLGSSINNVSDSFGGVKEKVGETIDGLIQKFNDLDAAKIGLVGVAGSMIIFSLALSHLTFNAGEVMKNFIELPKTLIGVFKSLKSSIEGMREYFLRKGTAQIIKAIAIAVGILALSLFVLAKFVDPDKLWAASGAMSMMIFLLTVMVAMMVKIEASSKSIKNFNEMVMSFVLIILAMAAAVAILAFALAELSGINWDRNALKSLGVLILLMAAMTGITYLLSNWTFVSRGGMVLVTFAVSVFLLVKALQQLEKINIEEIGPRLKVLAACIAMVVVLAFAANKIKFRGAFGILSMIGALYLIELALMFIIDVGVSLNDIKSHMDKFIPVIVAMGLVAAYMIAISRLSKEAVKGSGFLIATAIAVFIICEAIKKIMDMDIVQFTNVFDMLALIFLGFMGILAVITKIPKDTEKGIKAASSAILKVAVAIGLMSLIVGLIGKNLSWGEIGKGMAVVVGLTILVGLLMLSVSEMADLKPKQFLALIGVLGALALIMGLFAFLPDDNIDNLIAGAVAMLIGLVAVGKALEMANRHGAGAGAKPLYAMVMVIIALAASLIALLYYAEDIWQLLAVCGSFTLVLLAFGAMVEITMESFKGVQQKRMKDIGQLILIMIGVIAAIGLAMTAVVSTGADWSQIATAGGSICAGLISLSVAMRIIGSMKKFNKDAANGMISAAISFAIIGGILAGVLLATGDMDWKEMAKKAAILVGVIYLLVGAMILFTRFGKGAAKASAGMTVPLLQIVALILAVSAGLLAFAATVYIIVSSIKLLLDLDYKKFADQADYIKIFLMVMGMFIAIAAVAIIPLIGFGAALLLIAADLLIIALAVSLFLKTATPFLKALALFVEALDKIFSNPNLDKGMKTFGENIGTVIINIIDSIALGIVQFASTLTKNIVVITKALSLLIVAIINTVNSGIMMITKVILEGILNFLKLLNKYAGPITIELVKLLVTILAGIAAYSFIFGYYGAQIALAVLNGLLRGLIEALPDLIDNLVELAVTAISAIAEAITNNGDLIRSAVTELILSLALLVMNLIDGILGGLLSEFDWFKNAKDTIQDEMEYQADLRAQAAAEKERKTMAKEGKKTAELSEELTAETYDQSETAGKGGISTVTSWFSNAKNTVGSKVGDFKNYVSSRFKKSMPTDDDGAGAEYANTYVGHLEEELPKHIQKMNVSSIPTEIQNKLQNEGWELDETGKYLIKEVGWGIQDEGTANGIVDGAVNVITEKFGGQEVLDKFNASGFKVGEFFGIGYGEGIESTMPDTMTTIDNYGTISTDTLSDSIEVNSPSKVTRRIGNSFTEGFVMGIEDNEEDVTNAINGMAKGMSGALYNIETMVDNTFGNNAVYTPTISPVLDSSNMNGMYAWNDILNPTTTMQLAADSTMTVRDSEQYQIANKLDTLNKYMEDMSKKDMSKILDGVAINVDASTNVDGTPLRRTSAAYTIGQINKQERALIMARGARA